MRLVSLRTIVLLLAGFTFSLGVARANDYNFDLTNFETGNSIVGTGTFSFNTTLGDGTYMLTSLTNDNYNIDFSVDGDTFNNSNMDTNNLSDVEVVIYNGAKNFYFDTDCTEGPGCYGPYGGSLDFTDSNNANFDLTTEPNYAGNPPLDEYQANGPDGSSFGTYDSPVPEPDTLWLLGSGLAAMMFRRFHRA